MSDSEHQEMMNVAYEAAASLTGGSKPRSLAELDALLETYTSNEFVPAFGYKYGTIPFDSLRALGVGAALLSQTTSLSYIPDYRSGDDLTWPVQQIFQGLNIPIPSVKDQAEKDMVEKFQRIIEINPVRSWKSYPIDKVYYSEDPTIYPTRQTGFVVAWYDSKTSHTGERISVTYLFTMTMFYELESPESKAFQELLETLCSKLRYILYERDSGENSITDLRRLMLEVAKQGFKDSFGFEYKGKNSTPPDVKAGHRCQTYEAVFHLRSWPVTAEEVEQWMDNQVMRRNDGTFPAFAQDAIYDNIRDHILRCSNEDHGYNSWLQATLRNFYLDPDATRHSDLQQFACYLFVHGDVTIDFYGKKVESKGLFVFYLGLFASYDRANATAKSVAFNAKRIGVA